MDRDPIARRFAERSLDNLVAAGRVTARSARIWMRVAEAGRYRYEVAEANSGRAAVVGRVRVPADARFDGTHGFEVPDNGLGRLKPLTAYRVEVVREADREAIGECRLVTAPSSPGAGPARIAFGVMSCHQPFDDDGCISEPATRLLPLAQETLHELDVSRVLMIGDQMYSDHPEKLSLFDDDYFACVAPPGRSSILECTADEVRRLYQARYRTFWEPGDHQALQRGWACELMLDDHEIVDNFGAHPDHAGLRYRALRAGALDAYFDYQGSRAMPREGALRPRVLYRSFEFGTVGVFVMDLRSERRTTEERSEIYSRRQLAALERFFRDHRDKHALVVALSVPLFHVPDWLATAGAAVAGEGSDAADRWSYVKAHASRDALLEACYRQCRHRPEQRLVMVGGDIHVGVVSRIRWSDRSTPPMLQLVSSAISNRNNPLVQRLAELAPRMMTEVETASGLRAEAELLSSVDVDDANPCGQLNFGVLEVVRRSARRSDIRMRLFSHTDGRPPRPIAVFDSGFL